MLVVILANPADPHQSRQDRSVVDALEFRSAQGQKRKFSVGHGMSALGGEADVISAKADIAPQRSAILVTRHADRKVVAKIEAGSHARIETR